MVTSKSDLRKQMRAARKNTVASLPDAVRGLVFSRPPAAVLSRIPEDAVIGLYDAMPDEAPTARYAQFFMEQGHRIALPRLTQEERAMRFAEHTDPLGRGDLEPGTLGILQPGGEAADLVPDILFIPLLAFDEAGGRLGQGGGYYDRWLAENPRAMRIGLAWDSQHTEQVPIEAHDMPLQIVITPTRLYEITNAA